MNLANNQVSFQKPNQSILSNSRVQQKVDQSESSPQFKNQSFRKPLEDIPNNFLKSQQKGGENEVLNGNQRLNRFQISNINSDSNQPQIAFCMGRRTINQFEQNLNTDNPNEQETTQIKNKTIYQSNQISLANQNMKNKIPRTGTLRSFFKNENYNFDSQSFLNKSTDGSFHSQYIPQENSMIFQQHKKIDDFKLAESFDQQIMQKQSLNKFQKSIHFRTHKELLDEMSYEDKQKAIFENADKIELLADQNSQPFYNDITRQFTTYEPISQKLVGDVGLGKQQLFELDAVRYQVCSQSLIPKQIRKSIANQRQILFEEYEYLTPVARQNILKSSGHLVDDYYYAYVDCDLYLWKSNMETFRGINQNINERTNFEKFSIGDRINNIRNLDASYKHIELKNPIQCILFIEDHSQQFQPGLVVVTSQEILLYSFTMTKNDLLFRSEKQKSLLRNQFDLRAVVESGYSPIGINIGEEITSMKQCNKTGRIYYASHNSNYYKTYIHELQLYNNSKLEKFALSVERVGQSLSRFLNPGTSYFKEKIIGNRKRLQSVNIQERRDLTVSTIKKLIPDAINIYLERKVIEQIQIDQQRNVMYVLAKQVKDEERLPPGVLSEKQIHNSLLSNFSSGFSEQKLITTSSLIEIYDLGALGEDSTRVCRISQEAIFDKLQPKLGMFMKKKDNKEFYLEEMRKFDIISISPIGYSESNEVQLLLTLKNSLRVYIQFNQKCVNRLETKSDIEVERLNLQFDLRRNFKLTPIWDIYALRYLPNSHQAIDSYAEFPYPFQQHIVNKKQGQFDQNNLVGYCNQTSSLIYSENQLKDKEDLESNFLKLCVISKNQSAFCQLKELQQLAIQDLIPGQPSQDQPLLESFSLLQIQKLDLNDSDRQLEIEMADEQNFNRTDEIQKLKEDEYIIDLKSSSQLGFMQGYSTSQVPLEIQQMLGGNYSLKKEAAFGLNNQLWYSSLSQLERQIYEDTVAENQIKILTNLREINIVELRPVDQLAQILNQIAQMQVKDFNLATFEEFCDKFGIEEVCCMLLQIITSNRNSKFLQSQKLKQALNKSAIISIRQRSEGQFINPNQSFIRGKNADQSPNQKIQRNRVTKSSYSHRPGQFLSSQKKVSQSGQFSKSPQSIRRGLGASHQQIGINQDKMLQSNFQRQNSINLPYYLKQQDLPELYPFVYQNRDQQQNDQIIQQTNNIDSIYKDIFSTKNEINGNCNLVQLEQLKIKEWAHKLLQIYGDSINSFNEIKFLESCKNLGKIQVQNEQSSDSFLTYRFKAIYLFIQRILRPVWDTYLTSLKLSSCLEAQNSNFECLKPALNKLESLLAYLEENQEEIIKSQTLEDQNQLFNKQLHNFQNIKSEQIIFTHQFTLNIRERLDYSQRKIIRGFMIFIKRCIDSIQFIKAFSFADDTQNSKKMVQVLLLKLSKEKDGFYFLSELSNTKLKDLVLQGGFSNQQTFIAAKNQQLDYASQIKEFFKNSILGQQEVEEFEKSKLVRKLYELTVNFSARKMAEMQLQKPEQTQDLWQYLEFLQNLNVTSQQISGFAEKIQRCCPTFFSDSETVSLIGESLLAQALIEKDKEQQLTLVNNALVQIKKMPKSIVILQTAETLCKLNCFIEIIEVCLIKIKYLKNTIVSIDQIINSNTNLNLSNFRQSANSAISKANLQNEIQNYEEQLLECYFTILNLFMAIDQYISEVENPDNHSANVNMLEKIQQIESTNNKNIFSKFFNFWENKVEEKKLSIFENFLKQFLLSSKEPIQKIIQLREAIIHKVEDFGDNQLLKNLFGYIICQPRESIHLQQIPKVDLQSFEDVLNMIQDKQNPIKKECIDYLFKLMCRPHPSFIKSSSDQSIDFRIKQCLVGLTKKICQNNQLLVKKEPDYVLNQKEKIVYLQKTIDSINILIQADNGINQDQIKILRSEANLLQNIINHLQFQQKVTDNLKDKYKIIERKYFYKFQSFKDPSVGNHINRLNDQIKDLKLAARQCETMNYEEAELLFMIEQYQLRTLQFELLKKEYQQITQTIIYNENLINESHQQIIYKFQNLFQQCIEEVKDLANIESCNLFNKETLDKEFINCFLQLISFCNSSQLIKEAIKFLLNDQLNYFLALFQHNEHQCQMILKECMDTINQGSFGLNKATHFGILVQLFKMLAENQLIKPNFKGNDMFFIINDLIPKVKFLENDNLKIEVYYTMVQKLIAIYLFVNRYLIVQSEQASLKSSLGGKYHKNLVEDIKKFIAPQFNLNRVGEAKSQCDYHIADVTKTLVDDNILNIAENFGTSINELVQTIDISKKELIFELNQ